MRPRQQKDLARVGWLEPKPGSEVPCRPLRTCYKLSTVSVRAESGNKGERLTSDRCRQATNT